MPTQHEWFIVTLPDGRALEVLAAGPPEGLPLVFHNGTPTAAAPWPHLFDAAAERGLRTITYSRPGYAASSPHPGRAVVDCVPDVVAILDHIGAGTFVTIGWSGGGPHALACAALLADRCLAAVTGAGVAPYPADGLDFLAGMGEDNVVEFNLALQGEDAVRPITLKNAERLATATPRDVAAALGNVVSDVDKAALTGAYAEYAAEMLRRAVSSGIEGWIEDDMAFIKPWGFELTAIKVPVAVWQGGQDLMVPFAHGEWLAAHIPGAESHLHPNEGHLSLEVVKLGDILDDLLRIAGAPQAAGRASLRPV